jgi:SRSO17 transposase
MIRHAHFSGMELELHMSDAAERRFEEYVSALEVVVGNDARRQGLRDYVSGLLLPGGRKSLEPIAERLDPDNVSRRHQAIHHFISEARWSDGAVRERVRAAVIPVLQACAPVEHLVLDDTTLPKSGRHSVGVAVQYSGRVRTTCQSACRCPTVATVCRSRVTSTCPRTDRKRRLHAGVPAAVPFRTKHRIALDQLRWAIAAGLPGRIVLMDGAYGMDGDLRAGVRELGLDYAAAVPGDLLAVPWDAPAPPPRSGRPAKAHTGAARVDVLVREMEPWHTVTWREGSAAPLSGRCAACAPRQATGATGSARRNGCSSRMPMRPATGASG